MNKYIDCLQLKICDSLLNEHASISRRGMLSGFHGKQNQADICCILSLTFHEKSRNSFLKECYVI